MYGFKFKIIRELGGEKRVLMNSEFSKFLGESRCSNGNW